MEHKAQAPQERNYTLERDQKVIPIVRELLKRMADRPDLLMGSSQTVVTGAEEFSKYYQKVFAEDLIPLLLKHNPKLKDISYIFSLILQPFQLLNDVVTSSFEMNRDLSDARKYGLSDIDDLDVLGLDKALKEANAKAAAEDAAAAPEFKQDVVYYGPHPCETCGAMIVKSSKEQGGFEFDALSDNGEISYPNTKPELPWHRHEHREIIGSGEMKNGKIVKLKSKTVDNKKKSSKKGV